MQRKQNQVPDRQTAQQLLSWAETQNPGAWVAHSKTVARAAETIASACSMSVDRCYALGLLHDIGRYEGKTHLRHVYSGYELMMDKGFDKAAEVCLSHSFPIKGMAYFNGTIDCPEGVVRQIELLIEDMVYDDEIRLIQLCDALCLPGRVTVMEQRLVDVALRLGMQPGLGQKWQAFLDIKQYFDKKCKTNIYNLFLEEIKQSIFG